MPADWFEELAGPEHRSKIVERKLASVGLSLTDKTTKLPGDGITRPEPQGPPKPNHLLYPSHFYKVENGRHISHALAGKLGYRERRAPIDAVADPDITADDEGYEDMRHA